MSGEEPYQVTERGDPRDRITNQMPLRGGAAMCVVCGTAIEPGQRYFNDDGKPRHMLCDERSEEMTTETTEMLRAIEPDELELLMQARDALKAIEDRAVKRSWSAQAAACAAGRVDYTVPTPHAWGRLAEACDVAENVLFNVLNVAQAHCQDKGAEEALNRQLDVPESPEMLHETVEGHPVEDVYVGVADDEPDYLADTRGEHDERL